MGAQEIAKTVNHLYDIAGDAMSISTMPYDGGREIFFADRKQFRDLAEGRTITVGKPVHVDSTEHFVHFECDGVKFGSIMRWENE